MHTSTIVPVRTQTRSSNRSPSFEWKKRCLKTIFHVKSFWKFLYQSMSSCIWEIEEHRRTLGKSTKMKNYIFLFFFHLKKYRKNTLYLRLWRLARILSKITRTASCRIVSVESSSINTKVIFFFFLNTWHFQPCFISSLQMSRIWNILFLLFQSHTTTSCINFQRHRNAIPIYVRSSHGANKNHELSRKNPRSCRRLSDSARSWSIVPRVCASAAVRPACTSRARTYARRQARTHYSYTRAGTHARYVRRRN